MSASQNARNMRAGKEWERAIERYGRELGFDIDRTRDTGAKDQGDLALRIGDGVAIIEAKAARRLEPAEFIKEALAEAQHFAELRNWDPRRVYPVSFVKRRMHGVGQGYALTTIEEYLRLLREAAS